MINDHKDVQPKLNSVIETNEFMLAINYNGSEFKTSLLLKYFSHSTQNLQFRYIVISLNYIFKLSSNL